MTQQNGVPDASNSDPKGAAAQAAVQAVQDGAGTPGTPGSPDASQGQPAGAEWDGNIASLPAAVQKMITDLREENKDKRVTLSDTEKQQKELFEKLSAALGIEAPKDAKPDADALASSIAAKDAELSEKDKALAAKDEELRAFKVETALTAAIAAENGSPLVADVLKGRNALKELDPGADDFSSKLSELVKETIEKNPNLRVATGPRISGPDLSRSSNKVTTTTTPGMGTLRAAYGGA